VHRNPPSPLSFRAMSEFRNAERMRERNPKEASCNHADSGNSNETRFVNGKLLRSWHRFEPFRHEPFSPLVILSESERMRRRRAVGICRSAPTAQKPRSWSRDEAPETTGFSASAAPTKPNKASRRPRAPRPPQQEPARCNQDKSPTAVWSEATESKSRARCNRCPLNVTSSIALKAVWSEATGVSHKGSRRPRAPSPLQQAPSRCRQNKSSTAVWSEATELSSII
jgi:hypothetical protein